MKSNIWVTYDVPGFHQWLKAPAIVQFLRTQHRHVFKIKLTVGVDHSNRDVEFFTLQKRLNEFVNTRYHYRGNHGCLFLNRSCEMIAEEIADQFLKEHYDVVSVEVSEDGENGAIVYVENMDH